MRDIELDGSTAARLEVDEQQPASGAQEIARVRFAVQQLLGGAAAEDPFTRVVPRAQQQSPVRLAERGGFVSVGDQPFRLATRSRKCGVSRSTLRSPVCSRWSASA